MDLAFIDWILDQAGLAIFAAFALYMMVHQHRDGLRRERENSELHRTDKLRMTDALMEVAKTNTELCYLISEMRDDMRDRKI